jgi:hypothetical protein
VKGRTRSGSAQAACTTDVDGATLSICSRRGMLACSCAYQSAALVHGLSNDTICAL